mmetsp:Transcript_24296/g.33975  ORF Transcript_24296/g.33975 Transcript_24296/m.33975 type:complete len:201 (+) Transcript_24296:509-1111(+)
MLWPEHLWQNSRPQALQWCLLTYHVKFCPQSWHDADQLSGSHITAFLSLGRESGALAALSCVRRNRWPIKDSSYLRYIPVHILSTLTLGMGRSIFFSFRGFISRSWSYRGFEYIALFANISDQMGSSGGMPAFLLSTSEPEGPEAAFLVIRSFLSLSQLQMKVENQFVWQCVDICFKALSLNSNLSGNCSVSCQTQSRNW